MDTQAFFVDEFFADGSDEGIEVVLQSKGRDVPIRVKRNVTVEDRLAAELAAVTTGMVDGRLKVTSVDNGKATLALATRAIQSWPFVERATGAPLPITEENVRRFIGAVDPILVAIGASESESAKALDPSAAPSESASTAA